MKLSPEALAVAAFTFVTALLIGGWQAVMTLSIRTVGQYSPGTNGAAEIFAALVVAVLAIGAIITAQRVASVATPPWAVHLSGAAIVIGGLVVAASLVSVLATIVTRY